MNKKEFQTVFKKYAKPMILRSVFNSLMHTGDRLIAAIFIGAPALVATTLTSPLMYLTYAIAALFIGGLGAYVGLLIGRKDYARANRAASGILVLLGLVGIGLTLPLLLFHEQVSIFLGAKASLIEMTMDYLRIFSLSFPFMLLGRGLDVLIYNDDSPSYSFYVNIITTTLNLILNVLAVAVFDLGIAGLAGATVISAVCQTLAGLYYFIFKSKTIKLHWPIMDVKIILRIAYNGLSDFAMLIVDAVMVYIVNQAFSRFLTPAHFEGYAAANILMILFYGIFMGATMGLQPVISRAMGAGKYDYLIGLLKYSIKRTMVIGGLVYLIFMPLADLILNLFLDDSVSLAHGKFFYMTLGFAVLFSNIPLQSSLFFTAMNRPLESAAISLLRTLFLIPLLSYLGIMILGPLGLAAGFLLTDVILILALVVYMKGIDISKMQVYD